MKKCKQCNQEKEFSQFHKETRAKDGYMNICKECRLGHVPHKPIIEGLKICKTCRIPKDVSEYPYTKAKGNKYLSSDCNTCKNFKSHNRIKNSETYKLRKRAEKLKLTYGLTLKNYDEMYTKQNGCCKICGTFKEKLNIDHCHDSEVIRGLLCNNCNLALGLLKDKSNIFENAINYLKETNTDKS